MIQSVQDKNLMVAAEQMMRESVLCWAAWDKMETETFADCVVTRSPIDFPFFNNVMSPEFPAESAVHRIVELLDIVGKKEKAVCWWLGTQSQPENLGLLLEAAGAFKVMENAMMAVQISELPEVTVPEGVEIVEVTTSEQLQQWSSVVCPAHGIPADMESHWTDMYLATGMGPENKITRHFLALLDGKPVGATTLLTAAGLCSVANVATDADYRHRGIGSALTLWPLKVAAQKGYQVACLSASPDGEPVYARLGFQKLEKNAAYLWMPEVSEN